MNKKGINDLEDELGLGDQMKNLVGSIYDKHEIEPSAIHAHVGRNMRIRFGLSQKELSEALGGAFSEGAIKNYEKGLRAAPIDYVLQLSNLLDVSLESLIDHSPFSEKPLSPISTKLYDYVNHVSNVSDPLIDYDYSIKSNINQSNHQYIYYLLSEDDHTLNLPWGTRLLVRLKDTKPIEVTDVEQYYVIRVNKETHPDYGYHYLESDQKDPKKKEMRDGTKLIITKAKIASDIKNAKYVVYYDGQVIRHMTYRSFTDSIDGVVIKIIFEQFLYNKQRNTIPGVFPIKRK